jgi:hypothetical protein
MCVVVGQGMRLFPARFPKGTTIQVYQPIERPEYPMAMSGPSAS